MPNQAYAIEPFVTTKDGLGIVYEGKIRNIFSLVSRKPTKNIYGIDLRRFHLRYVGW